LHVLGLPLAFILSQDQTLHCKFDIVFPDFHREVCLGFTSHLSIAQMRYFLEFFS